MPKFSLVVPAFNEERLLPATLAAVQAAAPSLGAPWELIVCDNNSTDGTAAVARAAGARVVFEAHNQISRARNAGAAAAAGEWLVFVDADSTPSPGLFADLARAVGAGCLAGGSTIAAQGNSRLYRWSVRGWNAFSRRVRWAAGAFIFCEAASFRALGGFSEELYASEEIDLFRRLKRHARAQGRSIVILDAHPLATSDRKAHLYSTRELFAVLWRALRAPRRALRSAEACAPWYDGRR